jgi:hypothetical protein
MSISNSLAALQKAAKQVQLEDDIIGGDALLIAADQIANERGLTSPLKSGTVTGISPRFSPRPEISARNETNEGNKNTFTIPQTVEQLNDAVAVNTDVNALFVEMKISPRLLLPTQDPQSDLDALMNLQHEKVELDNKKSKMNDLDFKKKLRERNRYLQRLKQFKRNENETNQSRTKTNNGIYSEASRISLMLAKQSISTTFINSNNNNNNNKSVLKSSTQELLLRNMMQIVKTNQSSCPSSSRTTSSAVLVKNNRKTNKNSKKTNSKNNSSDDGDDKLISSIDEEDLKKKKNYNFNIRSSVERLSKNENKEEKQEILLKIDPTLNYSTFNDSKNCTFQPKINKYAKANNDEKKQFNFIARQEAEERSRRVELEDQMGKKDYDALVDKKICPLCTSKQSYDEVKEKRKKCPNCRVDYVTLLNWNKISKSFYNREKNFVKKKEENKINLEKEIIDNLYKIQTKKFDRKTGKIIVTNEKIDVNNTKKMTKSEEEIFFKNLDNQLLNREKKLKKIENEVYSEVYTFQPKIVDTKIYQQNNKNKTNDFDYFDDEYNDYDDDSEKKKIENFLNRVDEDLDYRKKKMPEKYISTVHYKTLKKNINNNSSSKSLKDFYDANNSVPFKV